MRLLDTQETIAAIASPPGGGLRGMVRLSGRDALRIASTGFDLPLEPDSPRPFTRQGQLTIATLRRPLPAMIVAWPGRRTFTGQPLAEVHTTGSTPIVREVLAHYLRSGARPAEPGEFTLRAFLSGRIDLTQAEAVLGVIEARSPAQLNAALGQLAGGLSGPLRDLRDRLLDVLAHLEANLDFVEESDVTSLERSALASELAHASADLARLADRLKARDRVDGKPRVVLVGPPNAGKSHLYNALLGRPDAIVSPVAGTTRDYLSADLACDGLTVELVDTAGQESPRDSIEAEAQSRRNLQAAAADLLLHCRPITSPDVSLPPAPHLLVWTKSDLGDAGASTGLITSAETGSGLPALRTAIAQSLRNRSLSSDLPAGTSARCGDSLTRAAESLRHAAESLSANFGDEFVALDLRQSLDDLGLILGATVTDDILDRIFQRFCIGK